MFKVVTLPFTYAQLQPIILYPSMQQVIPLHPIHLSNVRSASSLQQGVATGSDIIFDQKGRRGLKFIVDEHQYYRPDLAPPDYFFILAAQGNFTESSIFLRPGGAGSGAKVTSEPTENLLLGYANL